MTLVSQAEYARRLGITRAAVAQWKSAGRLVLEGSKVNVEASDARLKIYRRTGLPEVDEAANSVKQGLESVKQAGRLNAEPVCLTCVDVMRRLAELDWTQTFDWSEAAQNERARLAAQCIGWQAVRSDTRDDGHWGGYQLRISSYVAAHGLTEDAVPAGHGFELYPTDVLRVCRAELAPLDDGEEVTVRLDLLHLLAHPFTEYDKQR